MISKEKVEEVQKELDAFELSDDLITDTTDELATVAINATMEKAATGVTNACILWIAFTTGGTVGKIALASFVISQLALALKLYANYKAEVKIKKEYQRFLKQLKDKGIYDGSED